MNIESEDIDPKMLKKQGDVLKDWLYEGSDIVKKLKSSGWDCSGTLYTLEFYKAEIENKSEARKELKELGINLKSVNIEEFEDEESED